MFRENRRKNKELSIEKTKQLLVDGKRAILSMNGDNGYPYAVPINYLYSEKENKIYFHGSKVGQKIDSIKKDNKICFTLMSEPFIVDETWAPYVESCIVFGKCFLIEDEIKTIVLAKQFAMKYYPNEELVDIEIKKSGKAIQMFEIEIEHMSGKIIQEK